MWVLGAHLISQKEAPVPKPRLSTLTDMYGGKGLPLRASTGGHVLSDCMGIDVEVFCLLEKGEKREPPWHLKGGVLLIRRGPS